jgi:hypothetical protein
MPQFAIVPTAATKVAGVGTSRDTDTTSRGSNPESGTMALGPSDVVPAATLALKPQLALRLPIPESGDIRARAPNRL